MSKRYYTISTCEMCGTLFKHRKDHDTKYCSRNCAGKAMSEKKKKYAICPICGKSFMKKRSTMTYCSRECANKSRENKKIVKCENCGIDVQRQPCHVKKHVFCSKKCYNEWKSKNMVGKKSFHWRGGEYEGNGYLFTRQKDGTYKQNHRIIIESFIGRPLSEDEIIHHIDGDKKNNDISNLAIVSRSEHAKIHSRKL